MVAEKPRIVIIGAGMAGITAANKLYTTQGSSEAFELCVVDGGSRIGGRIHSTSFGGDRIELGATWIHGIGGSPVHEIAEKIQALESDQPWECMDDFDGDLVTVAEGGFELPPTIVEPVSSFFKELVRISLDKNQVRGLDKRLSYGAFLRKGLNDYWGSTRGDESCANGFGNWSKKSIEEGVFAMHEKTQRVYTGADDLYSLDYNAESEYCLFPGKEITIAKGYMSVVESLASVLPCSMIQLGKRVTKIEWNRINGKPVKLHFSDGSIISADHVIITVSLGVLKLGIGEDSSVFKFNPALPEFKREAISRLGFGVVNKLFLELCPSHDGKAYNFPFLNLVFHRPESESRNVKIPWWMRKTESVFPIYRNSNVLLSWFTGKEAIAIESVSDELIISGISSTISNFLPNFTSNIGIENGNGNENVFKFRKILKTKWGTDPLFMGSYSYVAVGSSCEDFDTMAEPLPLPLPKSPNCEVASNSSQLQILFAGEATHRAHYSTTHGAYCSGVREATRLLQHYGFGGI